MGFRANRQFLSIQIFLPFVFLFSYYLSADSQVDEQAPVPPPPPSFEPFVTEALPDAWVYLFSDAFINLNTESFWNLTPGGGSDPSLGGWIHVEENGNGYARGYGHYHLFNTLTYNSASYRFFVYFTPETSFFFTFQENEHGRYAAGFNQNGIHLIDNQGDIATVSYETSLSDWTPVEVINIGQEIRIYVNSQLMVDTIGDDIVAPGFIGFESQTDRINIVDSIEIHGEMSITPEPIEPPEPTPTPLAEKPGPAPALGPLVEQLPFNWQKTFSTDFESGDLQDWIINLYAPGSIWHIDNNMGNQYLSGSGFSEAYRGVETQESYFRFYFNLPPGDDFQFFAFGYLFSVFNDQLEIFDETSQSVVVSKSNYLIAPYEWYLMEVVVKDSSIRWYIERNLELEIVNSMKDAGAARGFISHMGSTVYIDNVEEYTPNTNLFSRIQIGNGSGVVGDVVSIPFDVTKNYPVSAFQFDLHFDPELIQLNGIQTENSMTSGFGLVDSNELSPGHIRIAAAAFGAQPISDNRGTLFFAEFEILNNSNNTTAEIRATDPKDGLVLADFIDGSISILAFIAGDANLDGSVTAGDAQLTFEFAIGRKTPTDQQRQAADYDSNGDITAGDAQKIFEAALGIAAKRVFTAYTPLQVTGEPQLYVADVNGSTGEEVLMPVVISNTPNVSSYTFDLLFDSTQIEFIGIDKSQTLSEDFLLVDANEIEPGRLRIGGAAFLADPIQQDGVLVFLTFRILPDVSINPTVSIDRMLDDIADFNTSPGTINVFADDVESKIQLAVDRMKLIGIAIEQFYRDQGYLLIDFVDHYTPEGELRLNEQLNGTGNVSLRTALDILKPLVDLGYLDAIPVDPFLHTRSSDLINTFLYVDEDSGIEGDDFSTLALPDGDSIRYRLDISADHWSLISPGPNGVFGGRDELRSKDNIVIRRHDVLSQPPFLEESLNKVQNDLDLVANAIKQMWIDRGVLLVDPWDDDYDEGRQRLNDVFEGIGDLSDEERLTSHIFEPLIRLGYLDEVPLDPFARFNPASLSQSNSYMYADNDSDIPQPNIAFGGMLSEITIDPPLEPGEWFLMSAGPNNGEGSLYLDGTAIIRRTDDESEISQWNLY